MDINEVYKIQKNILEKIEVLQKESKKYDYYVLKHFENLIAEKKEKEEIRKEYNKIPESYIKFKIFSILDKEGCFE